MKNDWFISPKPSALSTMKLAKKSAVLKIQDALYLKGKESFENKRLLGQLMPQGEVIILNLSPKKKSPQENLLKSCLRVKKETTYTTQESANTFDVNAITLTRFAIQIIIRPTKIVGYSGRYWQNAHANQTAN